MAPKDDSFNKHSILIVEDDAVIVWHIEEELQGLGYRVLPPALSLEEALTTLAYHTPDLVILDGNLGGISSVPVARILKARGTPFIMVSGYPELVPQNDDLQNTPCLSKPFHMEELASAMARTLKPGLIQQITLPQV